MSEEIKLNESFLTKEAESIIEMEKNIISAILNKNYHLDEIFSSLTIDDFNHFYHRVIFNIATIFRGEGKSLDFLSLVNYLDENRNEQFDNYANYISEIDAKYMGNQNIEQYIDAIKNFSIKKKLFEFAKELNDTNFDVISSKEKLWNLEKKFLDITSNKKTKEMESLSDILKDYQKRLDILLNKTHEMSGTPSGFESLDKITNGFQPGDLIILAARPGIGKTALSINFMVNAAKRYAEENPHNLSSGKKEKAVLMFSMEMGNEQICQRILSAESGIELNVNKHKLWSDIEKTALSSSMINLINYPIYIDDSSDLSIIDIQTKIKQMSAEKEIKLVVLDYLQLLKISNNKNNNMNRQQEVAEISRTLKKIARQFQVPIIAIAQLSRKVEERKGESRRPILSDLRESGSIEQDADMVCFLNYAENKDSEDKTQSFTSEVVVEFIIAKNRNGETTIVNLTFMKPISRYFEWKNKG